MATEIKVPSVGESITEGTISRWLKKDGEQVQVEEPLFELETEKATTEIPAPLSGILLITVPEGKTVAIGSVVGRIDEANASRPSGKSTEKHGVARPNAQAPVRQEKADGKSDSEKPARPCCW